MKKSDKFLVKIVDYDPELCRSQVVHSEAGIFQYIAEEILEDIEYNLPDQNEELKYAVKALKSKDYKKLQKAFAKYYSNMIYVEIEPYSEVIYSGKDLTDIENRVKKLEEVLKSK